MNYTTGVNKVQIMSIEKNPLWIIKKLYGNFVKY